MEIIFALPRHSAKRRTSAALIAVPVARALIVARATSDQVRITLCWWQCPLSENLNSGAVPRMRQRRL